MSYATLDITDVLYDTTSLMTPTTVYITNILYVTNVICDTLPWCPIRQSTRLISYTRLYDIDVLYNTICNTNVLWDILPHCGPKRHSTPPMSYERTFIQFTQRLRYIYIYIYMIRRKNMFVLPNHLFINIYFYCRDLHIFGNVSTVW